MSYESAQVPLWAKLTAAGMVASAALAGCTAADHAPDNASSSASVAPTTDSSETPNGYVAPDCTAQATPTDISMAAHLMAEPGNKYLKITESMPYIKRQAGIHRVVVTAAKDNDLTVHDERAVADTWYAKVNSKHSPSFQATFTVAHNYMKRLGVDLEIGKAQDPNYAFGSRRPTPAELNTRETKNDLIDTMTAFSTVPQEYLALAGLKHIYLVAGTNENAEGYTDTGIEDNDAYYKDIKEADGPGTDLHELSHMIDSAECHGIIESDSMWTRLNRGIDIYTANTNDTTHISYEDRYQQDSINLLTREQTSAYAHNKAAYCKAEAADDAEASKVITYSNYHTSPAEDKAEIMKNMPYVYGWSDVTSKRFPYLYNKFRLELARLYHVAPRIARYFAAVSTRTERFTPLNAPHC